MRITESWSISYERIAAFFSDQEDLRAAGDGAFFFGDCEIRLTPLPERRIGRFSFPQTRVDFSGPDADTETIRRRFVLQFISAGG